MSRKSREFATQNDLRIGKYQFERGDRDHSHVFMILAESHFSWSDESWDPMQREFLSLFSCEEYAKEAVRLNAVPNAFDASKEYPRICSVIPVPLGNDTGILNSQHSMYIVFVTYYLSNWSYSQRRVHDSYRSDNTGWPLVALDTESKANAFKNMLERHYRNNSPISPIVEYEYDEGDRRPPWHYCQSIEELTSSNEISLEDVKDVWNWKSERQVEVQKEWEKYYSNYRKMPGEERVKNKTVLDQFVRRKQPNEDEIQAREQKVRELWQQLDRAVLFKTIKFRIDDLVLEP